MWRPSLSLPTWLVDIIDFLHRKLIWLVRAIGRILTRVFGPHLPTRETARNTLVLWGRRYSGFSAAFTLAILPIFIVILIEDITGIPVSRLDRSWWVNFLFDMGVMASFVLMLGVLAVYFLRILYWFQKTLPRHWNRHTPPHVNTESRIETKAADRSVADVFSDAEVKARTWFGIGAGFFIVFVALVLGLEEFSGITGFQPEFQEEIASEDSLMRMFIRVLGMLPLVGEVYGFMGELPGNTLLDRVLVNGTAALLAIGLRNWMYLFERIDYVYAEVSNGHPYRYTFYLGFYAIALLLSTPLILILIAVELAVV